MSCCFAVALSSHALQHDTLSILTAKPKPISTWAAAALAAGTLFVLHAPTRQRVSHTILNLAMYPLFMQRLLDSARAAFWRLVVRRGTSVLKTKLMLWKLKDDDRKQPDGHQHPFLAARRNYATELIQQFCGKRRYDVSPSNREKNVMGVRLPYSYKDLKYEIRNDLKPENPIHTLVDVDHYLDDPLHYVTEGPILMYVLNPTHLTANHPEFNGRWEGDEYVMRVKGGATYRHKVWDWDVEMVTYNRGFYTYVCEVTNLPLPNDPYHKLVLVEPVAVASIIASLFLPTHPLLRWSPSGNGINLMLLPGETPRYVLQRDGAFNQFEVDARSFEIAEELSRRCGSKTAMSSIKQILKTTDDVESAEILHAYLQEPSASRTFGNTVVYSRTDVEDPVGVEGPPNSDEPLTNPTTIFGPNVFAVPMAVPVSSIANDKCMAFERNTSIHNDAVPGQLIKTHANEFIRFFPDDLVKQDVEEVIAAQKRPAQVARNKQFGDMYQPLTGMTAFMKGEPSEKGVPRSITQTTTTHQLTYGCYTRSMSDALHGVHWYCPGTKPNEIAARVAEYTNDTTLETDFSRFDARISPFLKGIVQRVFVRAFPSDSKEVKSCFRAMHNQKVHTSNGVSYNAGSAQLSGASDTTVSNTIVNAFVAYSAHRMDGKEPRAAWEAIGPKYGDDSLENATKRSLELVCADVGLVITIEEPTGGVSFLSRDYPVRGEPGSICDVKRAMSKMHFSYGKGDVAKVAADKATGYLATDPLTPLVSHYCKWLLRRYGSDFVASRDMDWKRETGPWPQPSSEEARSRAALSIGMDEEELMILCDELDRDADPLTLEGRIPGADARVRDYLTLDVHA